MAVDNVFMRGEAFDAFFDILDEQMMNELLDDDIELAAANIGLQQDDSIRFSCKVCNKKYKTEGGLKRHSEKKHPTNNQQGAECVNTVNSKVLNEADIIELVQEAKNELAKNKCYPQLLREKIDEHQFRLTEELHNSLLDAYSILKKCADAEKFFSFFYGKIVLKASQLIPGLQQPMSTLLAKHLGDKMLFFFRKPKQLLSPEVPSITDKEIGGLQYLAGYVVHKILKRQETALTISLK